MLKGIKNDIFPNLTAVEQVLKQNLNLQKT